MAKIWAFTDPALGLFYVRANDEVNASQTAANATRDPATGSTQVAAYRAPDGSYSFIKDIDDMQAGAQLYDARNGTAKWIGNWKKSSYSDWFKDTGNYKFTYEDTTSNEAQGPNAGKDKINFSPLADGNTDYEGPLVPPDNSFDLVDPVAGFLRGLGFDFNQSAGRARDFQQGQGALGAGTYAAQQAADFFADDIPGGGPQSKEQFGGDLALQNPGNAFGGIGGRALQNTEFLSGLGVDRTGNAQADFFNPFSAPNSGQSNDLANLLTAAFQGAGVSSLYNKGVNSSDIARMFTTFAGQNPGIGNVGEGLDQNFLSYAADNLGLSRFFNK
jgi:hypothetical protein